MKGSIKSSIFGMAAAFGAASLIYQEVGTRYLALIFGNTTLSTSAALVAFLGGVAIGSWTCGRVADWRPQFTLVVFAALQIATGFYGFASLRIFGGVQSLYVAAYPSLADHAFLFASLHLLLSAVAILLPAMLMGGCLPLLGRWTTSDDARIANSAGAVYGWTMLGAAAGVAVATYRWLPALGLSSTITVAAVVNVVLGALAFGMAIVARKRTESPAAPLSPESLKNAGASKLSAATDVVPDPGIGSLVLIGFAVSSFATITVEIGWARLLAMIMGSSVYAYSTLVVVVLAGQGIGSILYGHKQRDAEGHGRRFALLEFVIAFSAAISLIVLPRIPVLFLRFFPLFRDEFGRRIAVQFIAAALVALLPSLLFGATFPAVVGSLGNAEDRSGRMIGAAFAANAIGVIAGACLTVSVLMPTVGVHVTMVIAVLMTLCAGFAVWWDLREPGRAGHVPGFPDLPTLAPAAAALLIVLGTLPAWPREVFAAGIGFFAPRYEDQAIGDVTGEMHLLYYRDGASATISVDEAGQTLFYRSNGKTEASTDPVDMPNQLLLGHLPMLLHPAPRDVFLFGLGTGMTVAAVARYPVQQIDIVEPEPAVVPAARFFDSYTGKVLDDPRVHLIFGDGRNRLRGMPKQYDVVISDISDIWVTGAGSSATIEYYRAVAQRLRPGGIFAQQIDTHALVPDDLELLTATFHAVFPHMQVWTSSPSNLILLGSRDSVAWDYTRLAQHFAKTKGVAEDLRSAGIWQPYALFGAHILGESESNALARDTGALQTDDRPTLEFRTPRFLYAEATAMIADALNYYARPEPPEITGFDPDHDLDADGTYLLGFAYGSLGRSDQAITYMKRSTTMAPNRAMFFVGLGNEYRAAGLVQDADTALERAVKLDLNNLEALVSLGEIRFDEGQLEWTRVLADRALRLAPQDARVHALIGKLMDAER